MARARGVYKWTVIDLLSYLMIGSVIGRMLPYYWDTPHRGWVIGLLALYSVLFTVMRYAAGRAMVLFHPYFVLQIAIAVTLNLVIPSYDGPQDYFVMLSLPLCIQAMWRLPRKVGQGWVVVLGAVMMISLVVYYRQYEQSWEGIGYGLTYVAAAVLVSVFSSVTMRAQEARSQAERLNQELQLANQELQVYSQQVEQLAAAEERARLARDLHDSVSQTIFSMTLTAQAARILLDRDPGRVPEQLDHLQSLAKNALEEMRSLIQHLRPPSLEREGLTACLRRLVLDRKMQDGLTVELIIQGERRLPLPVEEALYRVVQEALNNVVKHAGVTFASVTLQLDRAPIGLCIEDQGRGFDPAALTGAAGHVGLFSMAERIQSLGGRLVIESSPGTGTRVCVQDLPVQESEYA